MNCSVYLAYDGSINADWVARYGVRMAAAASTRRLTVIHIEDHAFSRERLDTKLAHIDGECRALEVEMSARILAGTQDVFRSLLAAVPSGPDIYCVCGARATSRGKGFLAGTVSQRLLRAHQFNTLAVRVVHPGRLGCPANVMFPLAGNPRGFQAAMPFLLLLMPWMRKLILLRVMTVNPLLFRYLSAARARMLLQEGAGYLNTVMTEIRGRIPESGIRLDDYVLLSDDWVKETLIQAGKTRAELLLLGASDRFLQSRFFYGNKLEQILLHAPCDVGIYRKI